MSTEGPRRSRMSSERLAELLDAVRALLLEVGYERLTFDAVAARARTSKMTLYRHWPGKPELVMAALTHDDVRHRPLLDDAGTSSLDEVFARLARGDGLPVSDLRMGFMLLQAASTDPEFATALRAEIITPIVDEMTAVFEAAADRGEVVRDSALFRRLAYLVLTDIAVTPLVSGQDDSAASRQELFRMIIRPALTFANPGNE